MKLFGLGVKKTAQATQKEVEAENGRIEQLTAQLADIQQKASEAVLSIKALEDRRGDLQNELAEAERHRADAETHLTAAEAAVEQKLSEAVVSVKPLEDQRQNLQNELAEAQRRRAGTEAHLAAVEKKLAEGSVKILENQRQSLQNELAEAQARRADAEVRLAALAAERTKGSDRLEPAVPLKIVAHYGVRLSTYAAGLPIVIFAFIASFLIFAAVFGVIPWR